MKDYLGLHLQSVPYFRALLRAVEARFYRDLPLPEPTLDLGCGDGHFASLAFERKLEVGLDPWLGPVQEAAKRGVYQLVTAGSGAKLPFPDHFFSSAVSNSVLEHIPDLDPVLHEMGRVLKDGAPFLFCVPNHRFLETLSIGQFFDRMHLSGIADGYRKMFNRISRHHHCDSVPVWEQRLQRSGFEIVRWWDYFSPEALRILEWGHYFGLPSWFVRMIFGRWILAPQPWNLALTRRIVEPCYNQPPEHESGVYTFFVVQKKRSQV